MSRRIAAAQRLALAMLLILLSIEAFAIDPQQSFSNPADQQRYKMLTSEIRCLVCQNETIADSTALLALSLIHI